MNTIGIEFIGGLGNALFQFAFIYSIAKKFNCLFTISNLDTWSSPHQTVSYDWFKTMIFDCTNFVHVFNGKYKTIVTEDYPFVYQDVQIYNDTFFKGY